MRGKRTKQLAKIAMKIWLENYYKKSNITYKRVKRTVKIFYKKAQRKGVSVSEILSTIEREARPNIPGRQNI